MIVCDTSGILAAIDDAQHFHQAARAAIELEAGPFLLSPFVAAEIDYLLSTRVGLQAELSFLREVATGAYRLENFDSEDVVTAADMIVRYEDLSIGLADASIVVLADRYHTRRILTLDERHFRVIKSSATGKPFTLLPLDL